MTATTSASPATQGTPAAVVRWQAVISLRTQGSDSVMVLPSLYATSCAAMDAAQAVMNSNPDAYQIASVRVTQGGQK